MTAENPPADPAPTFDYAIGLSQTVLQRVLDKIYQQLYPSYFTGKETFQQQGTAFTVTWDAKTSPQLDLSAVPGLQELIAEMLTPELQAENFDLQAVANAAETYTFRVNFPRIDLKIESKGVPAPTTAEATVYMQAVTTSTAPYKVKFTPLRATAKTPKPEDQWVLDKVVIPQVLKMAEQVMTAITIPSFVTPSGKPMWPMPMLNNNYLVILANDPGNHYPVGLDVRLPETGRIPVIVLVKNRVVGSTFNEATRDRREVYSAGDSWVVAGWSARAVLDQIKLLGIAGLRFHCSAHVEGAAAGWVFFQGLGMKWKILTEPGDLRGSVLAYTDRVANTIRARIDQVDDFYIIPVADGNIFQVVISAVFGPLLGAILTWGGIVRSYLTSIAFDLWKVPDLPVAIDKVHFTARLVAPDLEAVADCVGLRGDLEIR